MNGTEMLKRITDLGYKIEIFNRVGELQIKAKKEQGVACSPGYIEDDSSTQTLDALFTNLYGTCLQSQ